MPGIPEVSIITSWHVGTPNGDECPTGLTYALKAGLGVLDLYFLGDADLPWFITAAEGGFSRKRKSEKGAPSPTEEPTPIPWSKAARVCPLSFAAELEPPQIASIAAALLNLINDNYNGRLIGPRPRIAALATYWPLISSDDDGQRALSVKAIQNSLLLAEQLGCRHVEIVGGFAFSPHDGGGAKNLQERQELAKKMRERRMRRLNESLSSVLGNERAVKFAALSGEDIERPVVLCLEIEPGSAYLIQNVESFHTLHRSLEDKFRNRILLNIDIAHMFLADPASAQGQSVAKSASTSDGVEYAGRAELEYIREHRIEKYIGHFHMSDHARTHASDLCPGSYHFFDPDYIHWLRLACDLVGEEQFSNTIAIEMEACSDIHEVMRAVGRTRSWLTSIPANPKKAAGKKPRTASASEPKASQIKPDDYAMVEGTIMAVDIVESTKILALEGVDLEDGAKQIDRAVSALCKCIQRHRGSAYSFTGDGVVAVFDQRHFSSNLECTKEVLAATQRFFEDVRSALADGEPDEDDEDCCLRVTLHWGSAVIPSHGPLKNQCLGRDVIIACRLLESVEEGGQTGIIMAAPFYDCMEEDEQDRWRLLRKITKKEPVKDIHPAVGRKYIRALYAPAERAIQGFAEPPQI